METTHTIRLPETLLQSMNQDAGDFVAEMSKNYAVMLFGSGKITIGQALQICGLSISEFLAVLNLSGVPVIDYDSDDLEAEFKNISAKLL